MQNALAGWGAADARVPPTREGSEPGPSVLPFRDERGRWERAFRYRVIAIASRPFGVSTTRIEIA
jgi:hypothetical protein